MFTRHVQRPVAASAVALLHPLSAAHTGWRLAVCSRSTRPIVLQKARATGSDIVAAALGRHTLPRRQLVIPAL